MSENNWKNRIVSEGEKPAKDFNFNPLNWRRHPELQQKAIAEVLGEIGWVQRVLINRTTGNVIDGHARIEESLKKGNETPVPFVEVELSLEEEKKVLRVLDAISGMAITDYEALNQLNSLIEFDSPVLTEVFANLEVEEVNLDDFFINSEIQLESKTKIVLEYNAEDYPKIIEAFSKFDKSPAEVVKELLL